MRTSEPKIEARRTQPYVGIRRRLRRENIGTELGPQLAVLHAWLAERSLSAAGPPFFRYHVVDTSDRIEAEAALPVASPVPGDEAVAAGELPAGDYLVSQHVGPYEGLQPATAALKEWAASHGVTLNVSADGTVWQSRIETYVTDPRADLDASRWVTEIAILVRSSR